MAQNTLCRNCHFAKEITADEPCKFGIPELIKDIHSIRTIDNYYVLDNYTCRYGISEKIYQENIDKFTGIDLIEYTKQQNVISYTLAIVLDKDSDYNKVIEHINMLSIKPHYLMIICNNNGNNIHQALKSSLKTEIKYKVHSFLAETPLPQNLHTAIETNKNNIGNMFWILDYNDFIKYSTNDSIQNLNYLINVAQPPVHYFRPSGSKSNFSGIFINLPNYVILSRTQNYTIEDNNHTIIVEYD